MQPGPGTFSRDGQSNKHASDSAAIRSFSGAHPFRSDCITHELDVLRANSTEHRGEPDDEDTSLVSRIVAYVAAYQCPRCLAALECNKTVSLWRNAGSRATACRCIPVCSSCGLHEALEPMFSALVTSLDTWPIDPARMQQELNSWRRGSLVMRGTPAGEHLLLPDGVVTPRSLWTGGWRAFGFNE